MTEKYTFPTKKNPMMNVLLPEIKYNKDRSRQLQVIIVQF